jgi:hypothetical protein
METSFFDAGGSSMLMVWVQQQLQAELGLRVPVLALFEYPTVRTLAAHLAGAGPGSAVQAGAPAARARHYPDSERRLNIRRELRLKDLS